MRGERVALQRLSARAKVDVRPLFILAPKQFVGKEATKKHPAVAAPNVVANDIAAAWGQAEFYLDAGALPSAGAHHPMVHIAAACRAIGLRLIPATRLGAPQQYQAAVAHVVGMDHRGVCLRVDMAQMVNAAQWQAHFPFPPNDTDLIADVADNVQNVLNLGAVVVQAFQNLHMGAHWRSVSIAGASMPENFQGFASGRYTLPRHEWALWNSIHGNVPYGLGYGDYATVSFTPPPSGIKWGFPINARYTLPAEFLICRGVATTGYGSIDMAPSLKGTPVQFISMQREVRWRIVGRIRPSMRSLQGPVRRA